MSRIIAIANQKGGVGKTTTAINLSSCMAILGRKSLIVDIDPQGNSTSGLGIDKSSLGASVYDAMIVGTPVEDVMRKAPIRNLDILPSNINLAGAEIELVSMMAREQCLSRVLWPLRANYDFIFIDCPPSLGLLTLNAMTAADSLIVPIQCEYFALEGLSQLINTVRLVQRNVNPSLEVEGVVLTMFDGRTRLSNQVVAEVQKFFSTKVYRTVIPRSVRLGEAPSFGQPISVYAPNSSAALAYESLAKELLLANQGGGQS